MYRNNGNYYLYSLFILCFCITAKCPQNAHSNQTKFEGSWNFLDTEIQQNLLKSNLPCGGVDAPGKIVIRFGHAIDPSFHADIALKKTCKYSCRVWTEKRRTILLINSLQPGNSIGFYQSTESEAMVIS